MPYLEVAAALFVSSILPWVPRPATGCSIDKVRQRENQKKKTMKTLLIKNTEK